MNTVGKILVVLNFLFAVVVGLFLVLVAALGTNWRDAYYSVKREAEVMDKGRQATAKVTEKILADYNEGQSNLKKARQENKDLEDLMKAKEDAHAQALENFKAMSDQADRSKKDTLEANKRLTNEIEKLNEDIIFGQKEIVKLQADIKRYRTDAVQFESVARALQIRNENLLEQVRELTRLQALEEAGVGVASIKVRNPNDPNPPAVSVEGKIEKVDAGDLVQISLGTDNGVNKGNTLDVFRMVPDATYLGMIRIVDAQHHKSVGQRVTTGNAAFRVPLREGDIVASKIAK